MTYAIMQKGAIMKLISWNVNGLRAIYKKGFLDFFNEINADIFCVQETKLQEGQIELELENYYKYFNYAEKKGYSGTAIFTKIKPLNVSYGIGIKEHDEEGRVITLEFDEFYLINCYTPNSGRELARLDYRAVWEDVFRKYLQKLDKVKPIILCGDLNVAHNEIDLKNPNTNHNNAGFTDKEREKMTKLLNAGFVDTYRYLYPNTKDAYTWWSYMFNARKNNSGWRIDFFVISDRISKKIKDALIFPEIMGSDHCPVGLEMDFLHY
jgi:exodeoxyribonuclease-3